MKHMFPYIRAHNEETRVLKAKVKQVGETKQAYDNL